MLRVGLRRVQTLFPFSTTKAALKLQQLFTVGEEVSRETVLAVNKSRLQRSKEQEQHNEKVKNYRYYEFFRGQDFIENIPYAEQVKYTLKDKLEEQKEKERVSIEELQPVRNHIQRASMIREKINAYHDKQKQYEVEEFEKYLTQYPGTVKGPNPHDDWEAYQTYAMKKMPRILHEELAYDQANAKVLDEIGKDDDQMQEASKIESPTNLLSNLQKERILLSQDSASKEEQNAWFEKFREGWEHQQMVEDYKLDVPLIPSLNFENYQHFINHWEGWLNFRNSYTEHNLENNMKKHEEQLEQLCDSFMTKEEDEWAEVEANIPSLYRYYKCLPQSMQDHPGMKDIYLGMEYSSPDFSNKDKEEAMNYTCTLLLPFDDISNKVMTDYTAHSTVKFTQYIHEKVFTMSPEFTWDMASFIEELRKQELRGETSNQNKDLRYPEPPELHKMWEEGTANLPVDFYDNEDDFWGPIIKEKLRRYDAHKPMLKTRVHFTH